MNIDNRFDLLVDVVFAMSHQLGDIGTKEEDIVTSFRLGEGYSLT